MTIELAPTRTGPRWPRSALPWLGLLFVGCATLGAWFLIHPALVGDLLLVRNDQEAACYRLPLVR